METNVLYEYIKGTSVLYEYINGNCKVTIYSDGTKVRETSPEGAKPEFPENIDIKITDKCDKGCEYCHENSTPLGQNAHFEYDFLWTLREGTELAIGGGNIFENYRNLRDFLIWCKRRGIIANITVNQSHLELETTVYSSGREFITSNTNTERLKEFVKRDLVKGVGISFNGNAQALDDIFNHKERYYNEDNTYLLSKIKENTVIHVINGVHSVDEILKLGNKGYKLLILGYKDLRRGTSYKEQNFEEIESKQKEMYDRIHEIIKVFEVISFDNLAIEQLKVKRMFIEDDWKGFYMGDEGTFTMYIDLVNGVYAKNSVSEEVFPIESTIDSMFKRINNQG